MDLLLFVAVLGVVVMWVGAPLRRRTGAATPSADPTLEVEREARLAAVRDAELDYRTGKLSERDHRELDAELRREALEAMRRAQEAR